MRIILGFVGLFIQILVAESKCGPGLNTRYSLNFYPAYKVCIDTTHAETYFVHHILHPPKVKVRKEKNPRGGWKTELYDHVGTAYAKDVQFARFSELDVIKEEGEMYFIHFHLAPVGDFDDQPSQRRTCYVENVVPGFQKVNNGNWKTIEHSVRKSIRQNEKADVITGQFGQLFLETSTIPKVWQEMTLERDPDYKEYPKKGKIQSQNPLYDHIKVPEFFYKIVKVSTTNEAYVIITSNNPLMTPEEFKLKSKMCRHDICPSNRTLKNYSKGYTYCCPFSEFANNLKNEYQIDFKGIMDFHNTRDATTVPV